MDKRKQDEGFTLIEMLLVLIVISFLLLLFPFLSMRRESILTMQVEALKYSFLQIQSRALYEKKQLSISCEGSICVMDGVQKSLQQDMRCYGEVSFNESGNASRATTFTCTIASYECKLIVQLGSGRMYVK